MIIKHNFPLADILWYKIGGVAKYLLECEKKEDIVEAFEFVKKNKIQKWFLIGLGSNLLFSDDYYDGVVIRIVSSLHEDRSWTRNVQNVYVPSQDDSVKLINKNTVQAFAGVTLDSVIQFAFEHDLVGLEWAGGLPGTVGAAIRGNVGAFGGEIKDSFARAEVLKIENRKLKIEEFNRRNIKFAYRTSTIKTHKNLIVATASLELKKASFEEVIKARQTYFANIEYRNTRHPMDLPSNGSAFKNIHKKEQIEKILEVFPDIEEMIRIKWHGKVSMGYLIKRLELSGFRIGGAEISQKHSNFIVNIGGARFTDVLGIIRKVQDTFEETFGFTPEPEVEIVE